MTEWDDNTMFHSAPNLVVEVLSRSTESRDRGIKFDSYQAGGVTEYWLIDVREKYVEQYVMDTGGIKLFVLKGQLDMEDTLQCEAIAGLNFSVSALFNSDACYATQMAIMNE